MKLHLGTYFNIPLYVHYTWFFFMLIILLVTDLASFLTYLLLFGFVTLHEYGHCLAAKYFNVPVDEVNILPIGGVATIHLKINRPYEEFVIACAGPLVNIVLFVGFGLPIFESEFFRLLSIINLIMCIFNLLPVFPMDGGRILRAILTKLTGFVRGTTCTVRFGQMFCIFLFIIGIYFLNFMISLIFLIMFFASEQEMKKVRIYKEFDNLRQNLAIDLEMPELASASVEEIADFVEGMDSTSKILYNIDSLLPKLRWLE